MSLEIINLSKTFGTQKAVDNISFSAKKGEIIGFLGPNGAGKSTTMKMLTGFMQPSFGSATVCGINVESNAIEVRKKIGYLPENNALYYDMYVAEYLEFIGKTYQLKSPFLQQRVIEVIALTGLGVEQKKKIAQLSKGYKQRVGLAAAIIHNPEVLILDEPTTGLDPNQVVEIRQLIKTLGKEKTVIFSTHIMQEVQQVCDRVIIINQGKIVANDAIANMATHITSNKGYRIWVEFAAKIDTTLFATITQIEKYETINDCKFVVYAKDKEIRSLLFKAISAQNLDLVELKMEEYSLEEVFQSLTDSQ